MILLVANEMFKAGQIAGAGGRPDDMGDCGCCALRFAVRAAIRAALSKPAGQGDGEAAFKNFHRSLCARFGYVHDEKDWRRDLVSLEEHIAKQISAPQTLVHADVERLDWLESDGCTHVFKIGNRWYTRAAHQMPHRRAATLRQAIDAARQPSTDAEGGV